MICYSIKLLIWIINEKVVYVISDLNWQCDKIIFPIIDYFVHSQKSGWNLDKLNF